MAPGPARKELNDMAQITKGTLIIGGEVIKNIFSGDPGEEGDQSEAFRAQGRIVFGDLTPIPMLTLQVFKTDDVVEPVWKGFNGELAVWQEDGGNRYAFSGIKLKTEGGYEANRDGGQKLKTIVFHAEKMVKS